MGITVLSLFDGMSCGQIALKELGIKVDKYYASEIDKHAIKQTMLNFPDTVQPLPSIRYACESLHSHLYQAGIVCNLAHSVGVRLADFSEDAHIFPEEEGLAVELEALLFQFEVAIEGVYFLVRGGVHSVSATREGKVRAWAAADKQVDVSEFTRIHLGNAAELEIGRAHV